MQFTRYAIYYTAPKGPLADFGASWLGWDVDTGTPVAHPTIPGISDIAEITQTPRKYGFHGTIKPPFRLAEGYRFEQLEDAAHSLCSTLAPVTLDGLALSQLGSFLAFTATGDTSGLAHLAASAVQQLDQFRAPPTEAELTKRRKANLSPQQEAYLQQWGYPYVLEEFKFHLTLSGRLPKDAASALRDSLLPVTADVLPKPFEISDLTLVGEREDGQFQTIHRLPLNG